MSDEESNHSEEVDDLFGDDEIDSKPSESLGGGENAEENEDDNEDESEDSELAPAMEVTLPRHALSHKPGPDTYSLKMPIFLNVDAHPFDPNEFKEKVAQNARDRKKSTMDAKQIQNDAIAEKLLNENTIRWRYSNSGNDEIIKQSNAHFIEWDDGLMSLKIGSELFDFRALPITDNFLARSYVDHEILQNEAVLTKSASLLPASTRTETHRKLTQAVKNIQKKDKILNTLTEKDPMLKQKLADENERKSLKMKRQLEHRRRLQEEKLGRSSSGPGHSESAYERFERTYGDEYDDEDDFVAQDDEELELEDDDDAHLDIDEDDKFERGAERLKTLKEDGASKYKSATPDEGEDRRKRRRIVDSDDDE